MIIAALLFAPSALAAGQVSVYPIPGSRLATIHTQISFRGVAPSAIGAITVTGSRSGAHPALMVPDSDGRGASFYSKPFTAGEVVTVQTNLNIARARHGTFRFTVETPAAPIPPPDQRQVAPRARGDTQSFHSRPDLKPVAVKILHRYSGAQDVFLTPMHGPIQWGPMIIDRNGQVVWFDPLAGDTTVASDLQVQRYRGQSVLTWWQGFVNVAFGQGVDEIYDRHYHHLATVRAGNGLAADLHEFTITPQGTALVTAYSAVHWDGSGVRRGKDIDVLNCTVQEIDIRTGNVLFQWDSLDHIGLRDSYVGPPKSRYVDYDYFHVNSIQQDSDDNLIISARNTWAVYKIDRATGSVMWQLGGKHSSFKMGDGTRTAYQHDAFMYSGGLMTIFDDGASPKVHSESRAVLERINTKKRTATLVHAFDHSPKLLANAEGSVQRLRNGHTFVGWGKQPYFTEFDRRGRQIFDGRLVSGNASYRAYEFSWHGAPETSPAVALARSPDGISTVRASWNGATEVAAWRVLAGSTPNALAPATTARRHGFETMIDVHGEQPYFAVQALDASGHVLGRSRAVGSNRSRVSMFSRAAFISGGGVGGLEVACFSAKPCRLAGSVSAGQARVAQVAPQTISENSGGVVFFTLSSQGRALLSRAPGGRLAVNASLRNSDGAAAFNHLDLVAYHTSGRAPAHTVRQAPSLRVLVHTAFISGGGIGGVFAQCSAPRACHVNVTVRAEGSVVASAGSQFIAAQDCGTLFFKLTRAGSAMLDRSGGNDLAAQLSATNGHQTAAAQISLVRYR